MGSRRAMTARRIPLGRLDPRPLLCALGEGSAGSGGAAGRMGGLDHDDSRRPGAQRPLAESDRAEERI